MSRSPAAEARARPGRPRAQVADRHIGARVRERRITLGLTQQRLAELVGITYQQAHKYETGLNRVSAGRLHAIARALGVAPGYFFEGLDPGEPARPTPLQRQVLELARSFAALPRPQQEALCGLARALAGAEAPAEAEETAWDAA
jgi:transcriptional regulator with XRE-family HTH domain